MGSGHSRGHSGTLQRPAKTIVHPFALCLRKTRHLRPGTVASLMPLRSPQGLADAFGLPGGNSHIPGRNVLPVRRLVSIAVRDWLLSVTESFVLPPVTREAPCHKMLSLSLSLSLSLDLDPNFTVLERPPCPKCHGPMTHSDVTSGSAGDTCTFECVMCNPTEKVTVESKR